MKDKLFKVKRKQVDWYGALYLFGNEATFERFYLLMSKHPKWSKNRLAYNALKTYYSTTAMVRFRLTGSFYG